MFHVRFIALFSLFFPFLNSISWPQSGRIIVADETQRGLIFIYYRVRARYCLLALYITSARITERHNFLSPFLFRSREHSREFISPRRNTTGGSSCQAAGPGTSLLHIITLSRRGYQRYIEFKVWRSSPNAKFA